MPLKAALFIFHIISPLLSHRAVPMPVAVIETAAATTAKSVFTERQNAFKQNQQKKTQLRIHRYGGSIQAERNLTMTTTTATILAAATAS